jgi:hypothetical protein
VYIQSIELSFQITLSSNEHLSAAGCSFIAGSLRLGSTPPRRRGEPARGPVHVSLCASLRRGPGTFQGWLRPAHLILWRCVKLGENFRYGTNPGAPCLAARSEYPIPLEQVAVTRAQVTKAKVIQQSKLITLSSCGHVLERRQARPAPCLLDGHDTADPSYQHANKTLQHTGTWWATTKLNSISKRHNTHSRTRVDHNLI